MDEFDDTSGALPGRWPQAVLAVIVLGVFLAAQLLSDRPQMPLNRPWIDHVADLPAGADEGRYRLYVDYATAMLPTGRRLTVSTIKRAVEEATGPTRDTNTPVRLGYAIREYVALAMPFFAQRHGIFALRR